ncbi:hypothetical protein HUJ04_001985 [Dendroctonus ponderosae]|uniref:DUF8206 domain-containing protein n=2 Tax=Dendroctonus ponderosae TaxID=77166 RepID=A0AAR5QF15_DENPD|nr:hypothetical protein HUJ04_001985 [Dendroctonus ponderosae]
MGGSSSTPEPPNEQNSENPSQNPTANVNRFSKDPQLDEQNTMTNNENLKKLGNLSLMDINRTEVNILLLGETGVGKSTFINSIFNYLQFETFEKAEREFLNVLIPVKFFIEDKNGKKQEVIFNSQQDAANEVLKTGASATQAVKTYSFYINTGKTLVRLIDTPGMGDTRGIEADDENCENILNYISRLHELHAICYLTKPQQSRSTVYFNYCVSQILSRLEKSACKNIVFAFTHARGTNFKPGKALELFKNIAEEIKANPAHAEIPLENNVFCFDNEAFETLAAIKRRIQLNPEDRASSITSWNKSMQQCWAMLNYVSRLAPHMVDNTVAINQARKTIYQLTQPVADIAELIEDNIQILANHQRTLAQHKNSLPMLRKNLYIPIIDLEVTPLTQPVTVCTDSACTDVLSIGEGKKQQHFKVPCHKPCYLQNLPRDVIGIPELMSCACMGPDRQTCKECSHSYKVHMHVYYDTKKVNASKKDENVIKTINTKELVIEQVNKLVKEVEKRKAQLEAELNTVVKYNAKFAHFLANNAIAPFSDSYSEYINQLCERERRLGNDCDLSKLRGLQRLLSEHNQMKNIFAKAAEVQKNQGKPDDVTPQDVNKSIQELFKLPLTGKKIHELFKSQKKGRTNEHKLTEYLHQGVFKQTKPNDLNTNQKSNDAKQTNPRPYNQQNHRGRPNFRGNIRGTFYKNNNPGRPNYSRSKTPPPPYKPNAEPPNVQPQPLFFNNDFSKPPPLIPSQAANTEVGKATTVPIIEVKLTVPASTSAVDQPPRASSRDQEPPRKEYPSRDGYRSGDEYPRRGEYRPNDGYPPRDEYPPRDDYSSYYDYPPRYRYPPRDEYYPNREYDPRDGYPRRERYPRDDYPARKAYPPRDEYPPRDPYPPRDEYKSRDPYPPRDEYRPRDPYPPRDSYPPRDEQFSRDSFPSRDGYPPRDSFPPRNEYPARNPYPPREEYRPFPSYGPSSQFKGEADPSQRNHPGPQPYNRPFNEYRGHTDSGGISRQYRKKRNSRHNSDNGDESDVSSAAERK